MKVKSDILIDDTSKVSIGKYCITIQLINPTNKNYFLSRPGLFSYISNTNINPYFENSPYLFNFRESWNDYSFNEATDSLLDYSEKQFPEKKFLHQYIGGMLFLKGFDTVSFTYTVQQHFWLEFNKNVTFRGSHMLEPERHSYYIDLLKRQYQDIPTSFMEFEQYLDIVDIDSISIPIMVKHVSKHDFEDE
jgi:hypothetical protein